MIYDIRHITRYNYETSVASARCVIRLTPRECNQQRLLRHTIETKPKLDNIRERVDFFGNHVTEATIREPHERLQIVLTARVNVRRMAPPAAALTPAWDIVARDALKAFRLDAEAPVHMLFPSRLAPFYAPTTQYVRVSFPKGRPILEGASELMTRIRSDFSYDPNATEVATPLAAAFENRRGVCQDFAHIMISGLRGIGVPAAYVSGYIRTIPAPGHPLLEGADASHAWVAIWCGDAFGWIHLDPTNAMVVDDNHIVTAIGRDYADVAPIDGIIVGAGGQELEVSVDIKTIPEI